MCSVYPWKFIAFDKRMPCGITFENAIFFSKVTQNTITCIRFTIHIFIIAGYFRGRKFSPIGLFQLFRGSILLIVKST